jgi:hypothetical protein
MVVLSKQNVGNMEVEKDVMKKYEAHPSVIISLY